MSAPLDIRDFILEHRWMDPAQLDDAMVHWEQSQRTIPEFLTERGLLNMAQAEVLRVAMDKARKGSFPDKTLKERLPEVIGRYRVVRQLGFGGMGEVFLAMQEGLDRQVAVKVLNESSQESEEAHERFQREAKTLAKLNHPGITSVFDYGVDKGSWYLVMEYVEGGSLLNVMRRFRGNLPATADVISQILEALDYAHGLGVIHRDVKPANILMASDSQFKVADFGLAKMAEDRPQHLTQSTYTMGTPHYMAPEQVDNPKEIDHRADLYSVGVLMYELLTGEKPIGRFDVPSSIPGVDKGVDKVVMTLLATDPSRRFQTAKEALQALEPFRGTGNMPTIAMTEREPSRRPKPNRRMAGALALFALAAAAAGAYFIFFDKATPEPTEPAVDWFEQLQLTRADVPEPVAWPPFTVKPSKLPRNPYIAKTLDEKDVLLGQLDALGLKSISAAELDRAYHVHLGAQPVPSLTLLDFSDQTAADRALSMVQARKWDDSWGHLEGSVLVFIARSIQRSVGYQRHTFEFVVDATRRKLGLEELDLDGLRGLYLPQGLKLDSNPDRRFSAESLKQEGGYLISRTWGCDDVSAKDVARSYVATFGAGSDDEGHAEITYVAVRAEDAEVRSKLKEAWSGLGARSLSRGPILGAVLVNRINPRKDPWVLTNRVASIVSELETELARRMGAEWEPRAPSLKAPLSLSKIECHEYTKFKPEPKPTSTQPAEATQRLREWLNARAATDVEMPKSLLATWSASVQQGGIEVVSIETRTEADAQAFHKSILNKYLGDPKFGMSLTRGPHVAVVTRTSPSSSYANQYFSILGRYALRFIQHVQQ